MSKTQLKPNISQLNSLCLSVNDIMFLVMKPKNLGLSLMFLCLLLPPFNPTANPIALHLKYIQNPILLQ